MSLGETGLGGKQFGQALDGFLSYARFVRIWLWELLGNPTAIILEIWNARTRLDSKDPILTLLLLAGSCALWEKLQGGKGQVSWWGQTSCLTSNGDPNLNFDSGRVGEERSGQGAVIRSSDADALACVKQACKFADAVNEEVRACIWGLRLALEHGVSSIGDCLHLITKLNNRAVV